MLTVDNIEVFGFDTAVRAMRNPMNSWSKSDSYWCYEECNCEGCEHEFESICTNDEYIIGDNDMNLMKRLTRSGVEHRTFLRFMVVSMDVTAPLYFWKEADRYRFKEQVSTSTMHKIADHEFTHADFSCEHLSDDSLRILDTVIYTLNRYRDIYVNYNPDITHEHDKKHYWWQMIQLLPSSYNQKRTIMMSYETVLKIIRERKNHKLDEWRTQLVPQLLQLPYVKEFVEVAEC